MKSPYLCISCIRINTELKLLQVSKRLQQELMTLMMSGDKGISAFPKGDNLLTWIATVTGPDDSVYQGTYSRVPIRRHGTFIRHTPFIRPNTFTNR